LYTGLEQHEGKQMMTELWMNCLCKSHAMLSQRW